jgi:hypothetical protein
LPDEFEAIWKAPTIEEIAVVGVDAPEETAMEPGTNCNPPP